MINSTFSPSPENDSGKWDWKLQTSNHDSMFLVTSPHLGTYQESELPHENKRLITQEIPRNLVALCEELGPETKY